MAAPYRIRFAWKEEPACLLGLGERFVLGAQSSGCADLGFLADVSEQHLALSFQGASFHGGSQWELEVFQGQPCWLNGRWLDSPGSMSKNPLVLNRGDCFSPAPNLVGHYSQPDSASGAALFEWLDGTECCEAERALLLPAGESFALQSLLQPDLLGASTSSESQRSSRTGLNLRWQAELLSIEWAGDSVEVALPLSKALELPKLGPLLLWPGD